MRNFQYSIFFILLLFSCRDPFNRDNVSTRKEETKGVEPVKAEYLAYHLDDEITQVYYKFSSKDLIYSKTGSDNFTSDVSITFKAYQQSEPKLLVDSGSVKITDINNDNELKELSGILAINLSHGGKYSIKLRITDHKKDISADDELLIDKTNIRSRQNFRIADAETGKLFYHYFPSSGFIRIKSDRNKAKPVSFRYYNREFLTAPPPYVEFKFQQFSWRADSVFTVSTDDSGYVELKMKKEGFYHCITDSSSKEGLTIFRFQPHYPKTATAEALVEPLRYLTTGEEYKKLQKANDKKVAVDDFWLDRCGSRERAREIIKLYYGRVEDANRKFASYIEGWRTDRGMLYIIFGNPKYIDKSNDSESWIYGDRYSSQSLRFDFLKVNNPFTDNDYYLQRHSQYKSRWHTAVDTWRSGRAYVHER